MKKFLKTRADWEALKATYSPKPDVKPKNQTIMQDGQTAPAFYPCIAVGHVSIAMTDYNRIQFSFVYEKDFGIDSK